MRNRRAQAVRTSPGRITLRDVAREAGVSIATASRVLNGSPSVAPATRGDVLAVIKRLEFAPDPLARALNAGGTNTVGTIIPTINHAIFAAFLEALEAEFGSNGFSLVIATTSDDPEVEFARARSLLEMGARALIVSGLEHDPGLAGLAKRFGAPVVATSLHDPSATFPTIGYDNEELARQAVRYLLDLGHTDIALMHGPVWGNDRTRLRVRGAESVGSACNLRKIETELSVRGGAGAAQQVLSQNPLPTALLCLSDVLAIGAMFEFQRNGLKLPEEMSVMGFDDISWSGHTHPRLTCMSLPVAEMGQQTARAICDHLQNGTPIRSCRLAGEIRIRASACHVKERTRHD